MVGVPRSKGCSTCRTRKKGCDRATPVCSQCRKAGFPCEGYARQTIFVGAAIQRLSASRGGDTGARPWISHYTKQGNRNAHITLPEPLVRTAREQVYMGYLWHTMTPKSHRSSIALSKLESSSWNRLIFESYVIEPSLRYVVMAWAMGCMAGRDQDSQMRIKSFKTYNTAVRHLSWTLNEKGAFKRDALIIASGLMASFEVLFVPDNEPRVLSWHGHSDGQLGMFLARHPKAFISGDAHQLFVDSRINLAMLAIGRRKASPFNSDEWKSVPWRMRPKSMKDRLIDIMLEVPTLLEQMTDVSTHALPAESRKRLLVHCEAVEEALQSWAVDMSSEILRFDYTVTGLPLFPPMVDTEFALLHLSIIYWFINMMVFSIKISGSPSDPATADTWMALAMAARKCANAVPLLFRASSGLSQNITGLLALSISLRYFLVVERSGEPSEELLALRALLNQDLAGTPVRELVMRMSNGVDPLVELGHSSTLDSIDAVGWF